MSSPPRDTYHDNNDDDDDDLTHLEPRSEAPRSEAPRSEAPQSESFHPNGSYDGPEPSITDSTNLHIHSSAASDVESGRDPVLPRWLRESSGKRLNLQWLPLPIRQLGRFLNEWSKGPDPPRIQKISPWFPKIQEAPLWAVGRFLPKRRYKALALAVVHAAWLLTFSLVIRSQSQSGYIQGYGRPQSIWCGANLWYSPATPDAIKMPLRCYTA